jgi:hypothetical protein
VSPFPPSVRLDLIIKFREDYYYQSRWVDGYIYKKSCLEKCCKLERFVSARAGGDIATRVMAPEKSCGV